MESLGDVKTCGGRAQFFGVKIAQSQNFDVRRPLYRQQMFLRADAAPDLEQLKWFGHRLRFNSLGAAFQGRWARVIQS